MHGCGEALFTAGPCEVCSQGSCCKAPSSNPELQLARESVTVSVQEHASTTPPMKHDSSAEPADEDWSGGAGPCISVDDNPVLPVDGDNNGQAQRSAVPLAASTPVIQTLPSLGGKQLKDEEVEILRGPTAAGSAQPEEPKVPPPEVQEVNGTNDTRAPKEVMPAVAVSEPQQPPPPREATPEASQPVAATNSAATVVQYNETVEFIKAVVVALLTLAGLVAIFVITVMRRLDFDDPDCLSDAELAEMNIEAPEVCEPCGDGTWLIPIGGEMEQTWNEGLRACLYLVGMAWCFIGIAIVCDQFMGAIEEITAAERKVWVCVQGGVKHKIRKKVWNSTVANLTLMALGSSAPEIMLSIIELMGNRFFAPELGPFTIVGSAAFNLLVINAVCISAIPAPDVRKVDATDVFACTAFLSVFAYLWLVFILQFNTRDVVDIWEAALTLCFFPMLILVAYIADKGVLRRCLSKGKDEDHVNREAEKEQKRLQEKYGKRLSIENVTKIVEKTKMKESHKDERRDMRKDMIGSLIGAKRVVRSNSCEFTLGFDEKEVMVLECAGTVNLPVHLNKKCEWDIQVSYKTRDGKAMGGKRYGAVEGTLYFPAGEVERNIVVTLIDDEVWEDTEDFFVELFDMQVRKPGATGVQQNYARKVGWSQEQTNVVILNDDEPGCLYFPAQEVRADPVEEEMSIAINRKDGTTGRVTCQYGTADITALAGVDYEECTGELAMEDGEVTAFIKVKVHKLAADAEDRRLKLILSNPSEGAHFDPDLDGGPTQAICEIIIPGPRGHKKGICYWCCTSQHLFLRALGDWKEQFTAALYCGGSAEEQVGCGVADWCFHAVCVFWKVAFSFIPPPTMANGYPAFFSALLMIGVVTAVVGDLASLLGCCLSIPDDITAITIVALGTSLPDTFASKTAAVHDDNADNSIGNVTGSNCVNVFLGLGLPWTIGSIYWKLQGRTSAWNRRYFNGKNYAENWGHLCPGPDGCFLVPAGTLSVSVSVFSGCAFVCLALLVARRRWYGGELGGPKHAQLRDACVLLVLWVIFIVVSGTYSLTA